jgi:molybdopterin-biosynthesis enzyme MoeA-like protein
MEETMVASSDKLSGLLPTADEMMEKLVMAEAEKADEARRKKAEAEAEKKMLFDKLTKPSGVSDEEALRRVAKIVERAVSNGLTEVQVYRFPNNLCTDQGRAINQREPGWEKTLTGLPKEMYDFWERQLRPRGYKIGFLIVDWSGGTPGDVGIILKWG